jgi:hypothetical protein
MIEIAEGDNVVLNFKIQTDVTPHNNACLKAVVDTLREHF